MKLMDKKDAASCLSQIASRGRELELYISEDICFAGDSNIKWVNLGKIKFYPKLIEADYNIESAIRFGGFEWSIPSKEAIDSSIDEALPREPSGQGADDKIKKAFHEGLQDVVRRTHLSMPVFDADTLSMLPLRHPTTIVPDTSAVHQGALDFVCRFLTPWARVKVPAIVHMEILTNVDNYFKKIRYASGKDKASRRHTALRQHLLSQGGQRALLRMELSPEIELDRGDLGADPLRGIVTASSDTEDKALGLQTVTQSFADRLILETARRFQVQVRPDHPLFILTSDQGMARMAMAEGMPVFFFQARSAPIVTGKTLTGTLHHPFLPEIYTVPLVDVLWELAVAFGQVRIACEDQQNELELLGMGVGSEGVTWQPLHAREDLLWGRCKQQPDCPKNESVGQPREDAGGSQHGPIAKSDAIDLQGWYNFSLDKMISLIGYIARSERSNRNEATRTLKLVDNTFIKYERFLRSGDLIQIDGDYLISTEKLTKLWDALTRIDIDMIQSILRSIPSFNTMFNYMIQKKVAKFEESEIPAPKWVRRAYFILGEATCAWVYVINTGYVITLNKYDMHEFTVRALEVYNKLAQADDTEWVLTGKWLEHMALENSIHPIAVKDLLNKAKDTGIINVFAEGSTPDTRFEKHHFWALFERDAIPYTEKMYFYHGDFLLPGISAVRIKIQEAQNAA